MSKKIVSLYSNNENKTDVFYDFSSDKVVEVEQVEKDIRIYYIFGIVFGLSILIAEKKTGQLIIRPSIYFLFSILAIFLGYLIQKIQMKKVMDNLKNSNKRSINLSQENIIKNLTSVSKSVFFLFLLGLLGFLLSTLFYFYDDKVLYLFGSLPTSIFIGIIGPKVISILTIKKQLLRHWNDDI